MLTGHTQGHELVFLTIYKSGSDVFTSSRFVFSRPCFCTHLNPFLFVNLSLVGSVSFTFVQLLRLTCLTAIIAEDTHQNLSKIFRTLSFGLLGFKHRFSAQMFKYHIISHISLCLTVSSQSWKWRKKSWQQGGEWKEKPWAFKIAALLTIVFDSRPQTWLDGPGAPLMSCQAPVTPLMRGHILCEQSALQSVPWTLPKIFVILPKNTHTKNQWCSAPWVIVVWLDLHMLEVCVTIWGSEKSWTLGWFLSSASNLSVINGTIFVHPAPETDIYRFIVL